MDMYLSLGEQDSIMDIVSRIPANVLNIFIIGMSAAKYLHKGSGFSN